MAGNISLHHLDFQNREDNLSLSSVDLPPSPRCTPVPPKDLSLPPRDQPPSPQSQQVNSPGALQVPRIFVSFKRSAAVCPINEADDICSLSVLPEGDEHGSDNEEEHPPSILSTVFHQPMAALTKSLSSLSLNSTRSQPRSSYSPQRDTYGRSNSFSFSSGVGIGGALKSLLHRKGESKKEGEDIHTQEEGGGKNRSVTSRNVSPTSPANTKTTSPALDEKQDSVAVGGSVYDLSDEEEGAEDGDCKRRKRLRLRWWLDKFERKVKNGVSCKYRIDSHGGLYFFWLGVVSLAVVYNAMVIPLRASFGDDVEGSNVLYMWLVFDYLFDLVYWLDLLAIQPFLCMAASESSKITGKRLLIRKHITSLTFWADVLSLLPLDILYAVPALRFNVLLRLPRIVKVHRVKMFQDRYESRTKFPNVFRVTKLVSYFLYIIHVYSCIYYSVSEKEGFGVNRWVYDGNGTSYLRCFYWAVQTVATTHNLDRGEPVTNLEYKVDLLGYIFSIFVLAVIFGEIRNIVEASNGQKAEAHQKWDRIRTYMKDWKLSKELQERVKAWYDYALSQQINLDEGKVLDSLPTKTKTDLAIHVNLDTLSRVSLFKDCEKTLLRELVLKLQPVLFVPNDFICKKGEIGKEMYIVNKGLVQVIGGPSDNYKVLAELGPGSVFGEISLLAVGGGNRRTAHVVSKGFSSIFVLNKKDLNETLHEYPDAREILRQKARLLLRQDVKREKKEDKKGESLAENARLASKIRNTPAAKVAFMAFSTAPAKAARAQAAAARRLKEKEEEEKREEEEESRVTCRQRSQSTSTQSTVVEIHTEDGGDPLRKVSCTHRTSVSLKSTERPAIVTRGLSYTSLWPSAKDVVITSGHDIGTMPGTNPNHT